MIATAYRICAVVLMFLVIASGHAEAQVQVQQAPEIIIVKPNPVATITGALLAPVTQNPNPSIAQGNNGTAPTTAPPYASSNGSCQPGYVPDGHGYCIVPYNYSNNSAPTPGGPTPYGAQQPCQPGYVPDERGACVVPYPYPNNAAVPSAEPAPYNPPTACSAGYVPDGHGSCVLPSVPQDNATPPAPPPAPAAEDTSGDCPAGYALDHDGNCSFSSETNPYQK